jgi:hypothetical protein
MMAWKEYKRREFLRFVLSTHLGNSEAKLPIEQQNIAKSTVRSYESPSEALRHDGEDQK